MKEMIANYWYLHRSEQASILLMHPYISDIVYEAIDENEYVILDGEWEADYRMIQYIGDYMRDVQGYDISDEQIKDALFDLHEQGWIDYDGTCIIAIYSTFSPRRACVY